MNKWMNLLGAFLVTAVLYLITNSDYTALSGLGFYLAMQLGEVQDTLESKP